VPAIVLGFIAWQAASTNQALTRDLTDAKTTRRVREPMQSLRPPRHRRPRRLRAMPRRGRRRRVPSRRNSFLTGRRHSQPTASIACARWPRHSKGSSSAAASASSRSWATSA
jgi:hypothetical protein